VKTTGLRYNAIWTTNGTNTLKSRYFTEDEEKKRPEPKDAMKPSKVKKGTNIEFKGGVKPEKPKIKINKIRETVKSIRETTELLNGIVMRGKYIFLMICSLFIKEFETSENKDETNCHGKTALPTKTT